MYCYLIIRVSLQQIGLYKTAPAAVPWQRIDQAVWSSKARRRLHDKDMAHVSLCNFFILGVFTRVLLRSQWNHHFFEQPGFHIWILRGRGTGQSALTEISLSTLWRLSHLLQRSDMNGRRNIYYGKVGWCPLLFSVLILELVSLPSKYRVVLIWTFVLKMLVQTS
jgi:hypothetical protein